MTDNTIHLRHELIELALQSDDDHLLAVACVLLRDREELATLSFEPPRCRCSSLNSSA